MAGLDLRRVAIVTLLFAVQSLSADYFDDQGNLFGVFRTDYDNQNEGKNSQNPLVIGSKCYFDNPDDDLIVKVHHEDICPTGETVYTGGPFSRGDFSATSFWVLSANVEQWSFENKAPYAPLDTSQGAPSLSTSTLGSPDLTTFYMLPVYGEFGPPEKWTAELIIDNESPGGPRFAATPWLSVGAHKSRGNSVNVGRMNVSKAPHKTTWTSKLGIASPDPEGVAIHYVLAVAKWENIKRILFVLLYHEGTNWSDSSTDTGEHSHWNWKARNSFWYPGGDLGFIEAEDINAHCNGVGTVPRMTVIGLAYSFNLDWQALFGCLSDPNVLGPNKDPLFDSPMPTSTGVPILGVHWAVEVTRNSSIWVTVDQMRMSQ